MALTKVGKEGITGIDNSSDATAITIDSSERVMIGTTTEGNVSADDLTVAGTGNSGITIRSGTSNSGAVYFSDATSGAAEYAGYINYAHGTDAMTFGVSGVTSMQIYSTGAITKPLQPAFMATSSSQSNIASGDDLAFGNEVFDLNADYNNSNYIFTAPITGKYQINATVRTDSLDSAANYIRIFLKTSNRNYEAIYHLGGLSGDPSYWTFTITTLADMDASDTAFLEWSQSGGASQSGLGNVESSFSGYLVA